MDEEAFGHPFHLIGEKAIREAARRGVTTVESEHVLLALLTDPNTAVAKALAGSGLDYAAFAEALAQERAHSLAAAGVGPVAKDLLEATPRLSRPMWGTSARDALSRIRRGPNRDRRRRQLGVELAIAILGADLGTVPRALALAGIERSVLVAALTPLA